MAVQSIPSHCWFVKQLTPAEAGALEAIISKTLHMLRLWTSIVAVGVRVVVGVGVGVVAGVGVVVVEPGMVVGGERRDERRRNSGMSGIPTQH